MLVSVYRSPNIIERDAIIAHLASEGIESFTAQRDVIVNLANEPNISLEGYSAMFNGYDILVDPEQKDRAQEKINSFLKSVQKPSLEIANPQNEEQLFMDQAILEKKILTVLLFGIVFPVVNLVFLISPLSRYFQRGYRPGFKFFVQIAIMLFVNMIFVVAAIKYVGPSLLTGKSIL